MDIWKLNLELLPHLYVYIITFPTSCQEPALMIESGFRYVSVHDPIYPPCRSKPVVR